MKNSKPLISVLLCVYNGERYLTESIESIINQTFKDWEMIAIDDGSTDKTLEILRTGLQLVFNISKHILPCLLMFGCKIFVINFIY